MMFKMKLKGRKQQEWIESPVLKERGWLKAFFFCVLQCSCGIILLMKKIKLKTAFWSFALFKSLLIRSRPDSI